MAGKHSEDGGRRSKTILGLGIASIVLAPLAIFIAPVTWLAAYRARRSWSTPQERKRSTLGSGLAVVGAAIFTVAAIVGPTLQDEPTERSAATAEATAPSSPPPRPSSTPTATQPPVATTPKLPESTPSSTGADATAPPARTSTQEKRNTTPPQREEAAPPKKPAARPAPKVSPQSYFLRTDDDAIKLDDAIGAALDGANNAAGIETIRKRIRDRYNRRLLDGGDVSVGSNLLLSAGDAARTAAKTADLPRLVSARRDVDEARRRLADELRG